eukprot:gene8691-biopygen9187
MTGHLCARTCHRAGRRPGDMLHNCLNVLPIIPKGLLVATNFSGRISRKCPVGLRATTSHHPPRARALEAIAHLAVAQPAPYASCDGDGTLLRAVTGRETAVLPLQNPLLCCCPVLVLKSSPPHPTTIWRTTMCDSGEIGPALSLDHLKDLSPAVLCCSLLSFAGG